MLHVLNNDVQHPQHCTHFFLHCFSFVLGVISCKQEIKHSAKLNSYQIIKEAIRFHFQRRSGRDFLSGRRIVLSIGNCNRNNMP